MAKPIAPGGVTLLDAEESAALLDVTMKEFRLFTERGFITAYTTPLGPRYREDLLRDLAEAIAPAIAKRNRIRPADAARILGVTPRTVTNLTHRGLLHRDEQGFYDATEVKALATERAARDRPA